MLESLPEAARTGRSGLEAAQIIRTVQRSGLLDDMNAGSIDFAGRKTTVVWRNPAGSDRVILVFAGGGQAFWLSLDGLHRVLRTCDAHVIYMRDYSSAFYLAGDEESGVDYRGLLDVLRGEIAGLGATRLGCLGNSGGGYAALRYALDLGAEAALSFSGITDPERWHDFTATPRFAAVVHQNPHMVFDLRRAFAEAPAPPGSAKPQKAYIYCVVSVGSESKPSWVIGESSKTVFSQAFEFMLPETSSFP